jgi:hypothetical protein
MEWININEQLPLDNKEFGGQEYIVTVTCKHWAEPKTMIMNWECTTVRNKEVKRWKWNDRIKDESWVVTHWMALPEPVKQ